MRELLTKRKRKMLHKALAKAETRKRWSTAEGWFTRGAWINYGSYLIYANEVITSGMMRRIMKDKAWRSAVICKVMRLRKLPD